MEQEMIRPQVVKFRGGPWDGGGFHLEGEDLPEEMWIRLRTHAWENDPCSKEWACLPSLCLRRRDPNSVGPYRRHDGPHVVTRKTGMRLISGKSIFVNMEFEETVYKWAPAEAKPV